MFQEVFYAQLKVKLETSWQVTFVNYESRISIQDQYVLLFRARKCISICLVLLMVVRFGFLLSARSSVSLICWSGQLSCETQRGEEVNI
jgi:hypothetical protein